MRQAERTPPATVFGMSNILRSSMTLKPISLRLLDDGGAFVGEEFKADLHPDWAAAQGFGGGEGASSALV